VRVCLEGRALPLEQAPLSQQVPPQERAPPLEQAPLRQHMQQQERGPRQAPERVDPVPEVCPPAGR